MNNKVNFLRGTATEYEASTKDSDVFYYTTDTKKLYLGANEVTGVGKVGTGENAEIFNSYESNEAYGEYSHAEGLRTHANNFSHAEGLDTQATGECSHTEGTNTTASGWNSHAEGSNTTASGWNSHAEGSNTTASGTESHAEGYMTIASNTVTHAGGTGSEASKEGSFVHGQVVKASSNNYEVAFGTFNKSNTDTLFSIGNGTSDIARSNAFEITKTTGKIFDKEIATKEDIPTSLPADGGNADTVDGLHANEIASNPNLLINPDFAVNQRGQSAYTVGDYTVDRWKLLNANGTLTVTDSGVIASKNTGATGSAAFYQKLEVDDSFGDVLSLSVCIDGQIYSGQLDVPASGNSAASLSTPCGVWNLYRPSNSIIQLVCVLNENTAVINWAKLEKGSISTPYVAPAPGAELAECQRFYQIRSTNDIDPVDLRPNMRATPTDIKQVTGGYAYVAEL